MIPEPWRLVLASASDRRRRLLRALDLDFQVVRPDVDESIVEGASPRDIAVAAARLKAQAVIATFAARDGRHIVIGADTVVVLGDRILGKPRDPEEAIEMLQALSARTHDVITGLAILATEGEGCVGAECIAECIAECTGVRFRSLTAAMIRDYVATGNAADKAGAYGVQEVGSRFIAEVAGDLTNVIGLPLGRLLEGLRRVAGLDPARGKSLAQVVRAAFPALESFPGENWLGIPD